MEDKKSQPLYKYVSLRPRMTEMGEWKTIRRRIGTQKIIKKIGIFNKKEIEVDEPIYETKQQWVPSGKHSDVQVDIEHLGQIIENACNTLHEEGYDVISIMPVTRGNYQYKEQAGKIQKGTGYMGKSFGFGYSLTDGVVIIGKLM